MKGSAGSSPRWGDAGRSHPATEDCAKQERAEKPPGLLLSSVFPLVWQVPSLQPWQGLSKLGYRYQSTRERDTSYRPVRVGWELGSEGVHPRTGWDGLSSQGQSQVSAVLRVPAGNVGKTSPGWSEGPGIRKQTPAGSGRLRHGRRSRLVGADGCSMAAPLQHGCSPRQMVCLANIALVFPHAPAAAASEEPGASVGGAEEGAGCGSRGQGTSGAFAAALGNGAAVN